MLTNQLVQLKEGIVIALQSIWGNKLRSFLTILGVLIGVASVIGMVSLIEGFKLCRTGRNRGDGVEFDFYRPLRSRSGLGVNWMRRNATVNRSRSGRRKPYYKTAPQSMPYHRKIISEYRGAIPPNIAIIPVPIRMFSVPGRSIRRSINISCKVDAFLLNLKIIIKLRSVLSAPIWRTVYSVLWIRSGKTSLLIVLNFRSLV